MPPTLPDTPRILVLRRHNHVGDMLCSLPLYAAVRKRWPAARIDLLATPTHYPVRFRELNPFLDRVVMYRKGTVADVLRTQDELRRARYDMAIVPSTVALSRTSHLTAFLSGARVRVGVRAIDDERNTAAMLLTTARAVHWRSRRMHQEERNREVAEMAGCPISDEEIRALRLHGTEEAERAAARALGEFADGRPLLGVHPGAGKARNIWPAARFAAVLSRGLLPPGAGVVFTPGALDDAETATLAALLHKSGVPHLILRDLPIPALVAVYGRLRGFLTNDTGPMHIAAYSGCPTLSLFGPTQAWEWAPRGARHRAIVSPDGTMEGISVETVADALAGFL